jgi:hypothetical protein
MLHHLAPGTHTVTMTQCRQITEALRRPHDETRLTAQALGLAGERALVIPVTWSAHVLHDVDDGPPMPSGAVLREIRIEGSPEFPYIFGRFSPVAYREAPGTHPRLETLLHTDALRQVSHALGLDHRWGVGAPAPAAQER